MAKYVNQERRASAKEGCENHESAGRGEWFESEAIGVGGFDVDYYRLVNDMKTTLRRNREFHMVMCPLGEITNSTLHAGNFNYGNRQTYGSGSDADNERIVSGSST